MTGYQSIDNDTENGPSNGPSNDNDVFVPSSTYFTSAASKVGFVTLGIILGCSGSSLYHHLVEGNQTQQAFPHTTFMVNGESFLDSLPFEQVFPDGWNPAQPRKHASHLPLLGAAASIKTSHLLYHAHRSAFGLLYDSTESAVSEFSLDYFLLQSGLDAQINQAYCAVASTAALLNSLKYSKRFRDSETDWSFDLPIDPRYDPYPYATQEDVLQGDCVWNNVVEIGGENGSSADGIFKPPYGLSLEQTSKLLQCHTSGEWEVTVQHVDPSKVSVGTMRFEIKAALIDQNARVMINFDRKGIGQVGGGHFSPLGAYNKDTDSFLIVDVAKFKYPPVWTEAQTLWKAMSTIDNCGTYDYPKGQERLAGKNSDGKSNLLLNPTTKDDYQKSLEVLNCEPRMRGYIIVKKKA